MARPGGSLERPSDVPHRAARLWQLAPVVCAPSRSSGRKEEPPHLMYQDVLANNTWNIFMRADQAPFSDVRVRRAISLAIDRQGLIDAVTIRGAPSPAVAPGLAEWSLPIDQLGEGAKYY